MKSKEAIKCLNEKVLFCNDRLLKNNTEYILSAIVLRKDENGHFYQAQIQDIRQPKSVITCRLEDLREVKENEK